jgi:lipopolysaccharide assembly outer membrane protein LptD (OstA)
LKKWLTSIFILLISLIWSSTLSAQKKESKQINIRQADKGFYSKSLGKNRLIGNVIFEHEGALMYCDSAWLFSEENRIRAFRNIRINQGDTLFLTGDYLEYSGNTKMAIVTGDEVILRDPEMTLLTDRLELNRETNLAYYYTGGKVSNDENILTSKKGYYNSNTKLFSFKDSVVLTNPRYIMYSDTLDYHSESRISYFKGPSTIISDSSKIYCENGRYNTIENIAEFNKNAFIYDGPKYLTGDSLYYEKQDEYGEAFGNVLIHDTVENNLIRGNYAEYFGNVDSAYVTKEPLYTVVDDDGDSLHVHGETLYSYKIIDSLGQESRSVQIFYDVRFFRSDMQGKCDSLSYSSVDSTFRMYRLPVIWNDSTQITGDTIYMLNRNNEPDTLKVLSNAFMISQSDSLRYNQVKGRKMLGKFKEKALRRVYVNGNAQTVYYPKEEDGNYIGMNRTLSSGIIIYFKDSELNKITDIKKSEGKMHPMDQIPEDQKVLEGFILRFSERPKSRKDLY